MLCSFLQTSARNPIGAMLADTYEYVDVNTSIL